MTLHSLFQSKMVDGADFLNGDDLEAILDILEADKEMEEEFILRRRTLHIPMPFVLQRDPHPRIAQFSPGIIALGYFLDRSRLRLT